MHTTLFLINYLHLKEIYYGIQLYRIYRKFDYEYCRIIANWSYI